MEGKKQAQGELSEQSPANVPVAHDLSHLRSTQAVPLYFLNRSELWESVKPYTILYYPKEDFPRHNLDRSSSVVRVNNMRSCNPPPELDSEGFCIFEVDTKMKPSEFLDDVWIENIYCKELGVSLKKARGARHVRALDFQVRRKDPTFPFFEGKIPPGPQPSLMTHVDVTQAGAEAIIHELYPDLASQICESRFEIITAWRPFRTPVTDWPLAVCSATSVAREDLVASDVIYPNYIAENYNVHYSDHQRWYWLPDQAEGEVILFKAVDSDKFCVCPHGAFPLPEQDSAAPARESIDVRFLVMYAELDYPESQPWTNVK